MSLLLTYFTPCSSVSIANFECVIAEWEGDYNLIDSLKFADQKEAKFGDNPLLFVFIEWNYDEVSYENLRKVQ